MSTVIIAKEGMWTLKRFVNVVMIDHACGIRKGRMSGTDPGWSGGPICVYCRKQAPSNIEAMYHTARMCGLQSDGAFSPGDAITSQLLDKRYSEMTEELNNEQCKTLTEVLTWPARKTR